MPRSLQRLGEYSFLGLRSAAYLLLVGAVFSTSLAEIGAGAAIGLGLLSLLAPAHRSQFLKHPLAIPTVAFLALAMLSAALFGGAQSVEAVARLRFFVAVLPLSVALAAFPKDRVRLTYLCAGLSIVMVAVAVTQFFGWYETLVPATANLKFPLGNAPELRQARGFLSNPIAFGGQAILCCFVAVFAAIDGSFKKSSRLFLAIGATAAATAAVLSFSKGVWVGTIGAVLATFLALPSRKLRRAAAGASLAAVVIFDAVPTLRGRLEFFSPKYQELRLVYWTGAWRMFVDKPILGQGLGTFPERLPKFVEYYRINSLPQPVHPHSIFLENLAGTGLLGMAAFLAWIFFAFQSAYRRCRNPRFAYGAASFAALSFLVVAGFFDRLLTVVGFAPALAVVLAIGLLPAVTDRNDLGTMA